EWPETHLRRALSNHRDNVGWVFGRGSQAGMLETVYACLQPATNLFGSVCVGDYGQLVLVCLINDGEDFFHSHLVLIDQLDEIDPGFRQGAHFGARIIGALHAPTEIFCAGIWFVLDEWTGDVKRRSREIAFVDSIPDCEDWFERRAQITCAGNSG